MASRSSLGFAWTAALRPSQAAKRPYAVGTDAAPKTRALQWYCTPSMNATAKRYSSGDKGA
eukprot:7189804-Alexandrium_andersonii.AAC.1